MKPTAGAAARLAALYENPFGGKKRGRYRISMRLLCRLMGQRRVWPDQIEAIRRDLYQRGYALLDMETYFAVISHQTFSSYRRVNEEKLLATFGGPDPIPPDDMDEAAE